LLHNIHFGVGQHTWPLYCIIFCRHSVARGSTRSCVSALVTKTPILLTSKPKVDRALFMACLRCIRCCTTFVLVLINTLGHFVASYFAIVVSQEVARPSCQPIMSANKSVVIVKKIGCHSQQSVVMSPNPVYEKSHPIFILKTRVKIQKPVLGAFVVAQHLFWC